MLTIISTKITPGEDVFGSVSTVHSPIYSLVCEDKVGNKFDVETSRDTFAQITDFLDKLKEI